jgi:hypothetical protein
MMTPPTWTIRTDAESVEWQRRVAAKFPLVPQHRLLRLALRYGLRSAALHPDLLVEEAAASPDQKLPSAE